MSITVQNVPQCDLRKLRDVQNCLLTGLKNLILSNVKLNLVVQSSTIKQNKQNTHIKHMKINK